MKLDKHSFFQFIRFCIVGFTNTFLSYGIYVGLLKLFSILSFELKYDYLVATVIAFILSVFWSFIWNRIFVFKEKNGFWLPLLKTYVAYSFTCLFLNSCLNWIWIEVVGISKVIAPLINLTLTVPLNFLLNKFWAFGKKKNSSE